MDRKELAHFMRYLADNIESGDCLGGSITFNAFYGVDHSKNEVEFFSCNRVGNLSGQGGISVFYDFAPNGILKNYMGITDDNIDIVAFGTLPKI